MNTTNLKNKTQEFYTRLMHEYDKFKLSVLLFFKGALSLMRKISRSQLKPTEFKLGILL